MKSKQRKFLSELSDYCNKLGATLDATATNSRKYIDRQEALMKAYKVIYAVLTDHPDNDQSWLDYEQAEVALRELKELSNKVYPDRNGFFTTTPTP